MHANGWWDNEERTIARYELTPGWDWQDLCEVIDQTDALVRRQRSPIHCIINMQEVEPSPATFQLVRSTLEAGRTFVTRAREIEFAVVIVGASLLIKTLYSQFEIAYTGGVTGLHFVESLEQARAILAKYQRTDTIYAVTASA